MDSEVVAERTNRVPATMVGGRRKSQPSALPHLHQKEETQQEAKDARDEEGESKDLIRQDELDKEFLHKQTQQQQQREMNTKKFTNAELNRAPNIVATKNIRQPQRFPSGLPLQSRKIIKEMSG
ncbi:hypothetical protein IW140_004890 [Coemansia sp. RSA 1813]|nr:hypothetical protein EV178_002231 [Coemansia sp. RSA 1646]KAJ1770173.1 hypothetical protein LPJ74_003396 [Coemansia sp. RSA 1843]KAJ2089991.1 hypothetical protein IW138_002960 [Coemansia sp. RSA 986]KAJ2217048.1 hypothetical protein EV179_000815 [Coemansia sp. RSA 487]KAJ2566564.1 hypothetical protein IW140_004890 [Coemansia sp. RSA 1813]